MSRTFLVLSRICISYFVFRVSCCSLSEGLEISDCHATSFPLVPFRVVDLLTISSVLQLCKQLLLRSR